MRKPEYQWETQRYRARRRAELEPEWQGRTRAEAFDLLPRGRQPPARAWLSLDHQMIEAAALECDPELPQAIRAWLVARGARALHLTDERGHTISRAAIDPWELGIPPLRPPQTLITLCPSNAEMVASLGCFDRVIACEDSSDYPPEIRSRERLGPDLAPDLDRIATLAPDLVVASLSVPGMERVVTGLQVRGIPHAVLAPRRLADIDAELIALARWLGLGPRGRQVVARIERERAELRAQRPPRPLRIYLEWWPRPMFTPGADCYSNELIDLAGGINVFGDRPGSSLEITPEELVAADPDLCFVSWCGVAEERLDPDNLIQRPGLEGLRAAREGRVYRLDEAFTGRPGPRMTEAARRIALRIHAHLGSP